MSNERSDWLSRVKAVEREHTAMRFTADHVLRSLGEGAVELEEDLKRLDVTRASDRLEGTYAIRLFSEFEVGLKDFLMAQGVKKIPGTRSRSSIESPHTSSSRDRSSTMLTRSGCIGTNSFINWCMASPRPRK